MKITFNMQNVTFGRKPNPDEKKQGRYALYESCKWLNKNKVAMIVPQSAFPSKEGEDTGLGSPYSESGRKFVQDISWWGINSIQYLPTSKLNKKDPNSYVGSVFSRNELLIDLKELTGKKWANILDRDIYNSIIEEKKDIKKEKVILPYSEEEIELEGDNIIFYSYIEPKADYALKNAYKNLINKKDLSPNAQKLYERFKEFCRKNDYWLEKDSLYYVLDDFYNNVSYENWEGKNAFIDKNLFDREIISENEAQERIESIKNDENFSEELEFYEFKQFVLNSQHKEFQDYCEKLGKIIAHKSGVKDKNAAESFEIKTLDDASSGLGNSQKWGYPDIFIKGLVMGCASSNLKAMKHGNWNYKVIDYKKLDGTAGEFLYNKFYKSFSENKGGIRVDHAQGYINPQVTPEGTSINENSPKLRTVSSDDPLIQDYMIFDEKAHGADDLLKPENKDNFNELAKVFDIILQAAKDSGVSKDNIMFEAIDDWSNVTGKILEKKELGKIVNARWGTHWHRNIDWATLGNHDNNSLKKWSDELYQNYNRESLKAWSDELFSNDSEEASQKWNDEQGRLEWQEPEGLKRFVCILKNNLRLNQDEIESIICNQDKEEAKKNFIKYQFVNLFSSNAQNIQVFAPDFFATGDYYQTPNDPSDPKNWRVKLIHNNYEKEYYQKLVKNEGLNMPEIIALAIKARCRRENRELPYELLDKLEQYKNILKE